MLIADVTRPIAEIRPCVEIAKASLAVVATSTPVTYSPVFAIRGSAKRSKI